MCCGGAAESVDVIGLELATRYYVFGSFTLEPICLRSREGEGHQSPNCRDG